MSIEGHAGERILGWDLLRGLCALTVATYHLLYWLGIAELPALGTYGVYMFFVLSGASLAYNYDAARLRGARHMGAFLWARWVRLAPLYLVLCPVYLVMLAGHYGAFTDRIPQRLLWNGTFAFGLNDPVVTALLIGGWSLGIEFVYYLFFPALLRALPHLAMAFGLFAAFVALQAYWIVTTVGAKGWSDGSVEYHQAPAFVAYFFGGCILGQLRREQRRGWPLRAGLAAWGAMGLLLFTLMPQRAGDELRGARGMALFVACFAVVYVSGRVDVKGRVRGLAAWLGDVTYGCYLLHPMVIWAVLWFVLPKAPELAMPLRVALLLGVLAVTCALATASERWFEKPLRRRARKLGSATPAYKETASISS